MARKFVEPGEVIDYVNSTGSTINVDSVVKFGHQLGVALTTMENGQNGRLALEGVFKNLPKVSGAVFAVGDRLVWDDSAGAFDDSAAISDTGDIVEAAVAVEAGADGQTTCTVKLAAGSRAQLAIVLQPSDVGRQENYNPAGLASAREIRWIGAGPLFIGGLAVLDDGREIIFTNGTTDQVVVFEHENTTNTAANRLQLPDSLPALLFPGDTITFRRNGVLSRWVVIAWPTRGQGMGLTHFDDYLLGNPPVSTNGSGASSFLGADTPGAPEYPIGDWHIDTGTTSAGRASVGNGNSAIAPGQGWAAYAARARVEVLPDGTETYSLVMGFHDAHGGTLTDGAAWELRYNGSAAELARTRASATVVTRDAADSPTPSTSYIWLLIFINPAWTRADFIHSADGMSFALGASHTTGLPASGRHTGVGATIIKSLGTTERIAHLDCQGHRVSSFARG